MTAPTQAHRMDSAGDAEAKELANCPFCGSDADFGEIGGAEETPDAGGHFVQCLNSACSASSALIFPLMDDAKPLLRERWNRRAAPEVKQPQQPERPCARRWRWLAPRWLRFRCRWAMTLRIYQGSTQH